MRKLSEACHIVVQEYQRSIKHSLFPPDSNSLYCVRLLTREKLGFDFLKFSFSKKAIKFFAIFLMVFTFCGLLKIDELYQRNFEVKEKLFVLLKSHLFNIVS